MKRLILLISTIILTLPLFGDPIDETTAKQLAQNFWKENNIMGVKGDKVFKKKMGDARFVNVAPQCGYSEFFIFNNEDGKGFVIIAADDCVTPILGYSYDNNFVAENLPPNLKGWLDGYAEQIRMAVEMRATATNEIRANWECLRQGKNMPIKSETSVSELLSTSWNQDYPYCYYCPYNSIYSQYTPTGCIATAMAQIMKYWEYPAHGYGYNEYYCFPYGTQSANFGNTIYDWDNMLDDYSGNYNSTQRNAVALLMYHCGVSVNMDYDVNDGSGAYIIINDNDGYHEHCAEDAFERFFGYSSSIQGLKRDDHQSNWISKLKNELNNYRPILYAGSGTEAHAFVCDGYNNSNFFHFNWGWGGNGQGAINNYGYFILDYLTPTVNNNTYNFSNYQIAIIGIQPESYCISATSSPYEGGSVSGQGTYYQDRNCTLIATANPGYSFVSWTENGSIVYTNPNYTFAVTRDKYLVANFQRDNYTITATANPTNGGTVSGGNTFYYGQTCTLKATAKTGYNFVNWTENGTQVSTSANYSFTVSGNRNLVANFQRGNHTIQLLAHPSTGGSVSGGGSFSPNQTCTVSAIAKNGYTFQKWTENGNQVSTNANYTFTVTSNRNLIAHFIRYTHTILTTVGANGSITPSGTITVSHGADQTFNIIPDQDYEIKEVYVDGSSVGAISSYTFTNVTEDHRIYATFNRFIGVDETNEDEIKIYPNPTQGEITLEGEGLSHVRIVNAYGQMVYNAKVESNQVRIDLSQMAKGIYMMHIEAEGGQAVRKIVVE